MTQVATDTPPTAPADTSAGAAAAAGQSGTPSNPGGAATYNTGGTVATSGGVSLLSGLPTPTGQMPTSAPGAIENVQVDDVIPGSPAHQKGFGKGSKRPDITRLSDLVKLVNAVDTGQPLDHFDATVLNTIFAGAKLSGDEQAILKAGVAGTDPHIDSILHRFNTTAWNGIMEHLKSLGVAVPPDLQSAPNVNNVNSKLSALGKVRLELPTTDALRRNGYNTAGMTDVQTLISGHDAHQFAAGAPGIIKTIPGTPQHEGTVAGSELYDDFYKSWQANGKINRDPFTGQEIGAQTYQQAMTADLVAIGALDTTSGTITDQEVANAYASVIQQAHDSSKTVPEMFQEINGSNPPETNLDQAYVQHVADSILGPNALTPFQITALANLANKQGVSSSAGADAINEGVVSDYLHELSANGKPITDGSSYAALAYQTINDTLQQWGVPATPSLIAKLSGQVLQSGINTPYQVKDLAATTTEAYAKQQVGSLYGAGVGAQANAGVSVADQASSYLQTASQLLGSPLSEMSLTDPTGKWMKWSQGGSGPGGTMTQSEWGQYLMSNPDYGFDHSQTAKTEYSNAANGLLTLMGKLPQSAPNPFAGASASTLIGGNG